MKKTAITICFLSVFLALFGQGTPAWVSENIRDLRYPSETFYTGFVYNIVEQGKSPQSYIEHSKTDAQADLVKKIRLRIEAKTQSNVYTQSTNGNYNENEIFQNEAKTYAEAEIVGIKTESYYDKATSTVYAFAYANKYELIGYYKSNLSLNITQAEGILQTAQALEANREKAKARQQCEAVLPLLAKVRYAQDLISVIDINASFEDLQQAKTNNIYSTLKQMQARLAQAVYVYIVSNESLFGKSENIIANKIKADLAQKGCSFVETAESADFQLKIDVDVRLSSQSEGMVFCFADVKIELFDTNKQKTVFGDAFSEKGGSSSQEKAGRKAMEYASTKIVEKLKNRIE
jgi:hypothetical protein